MSANTTTFPTPNELTDIAYEVITEKNKAICEKARAFLMGHIQDELLKAANAGKFGIHVLLNAHLNDDDMIVYCDTIREELHQFGYTDDNVQIKKGTVRDRSVYTLILTWGASKVLELPETQPEMISVQFAGVAV